MLKYVRREGGGTTRLSAPLSTIQSLAQQVPRPRRPLIVSGHTNTGEADAAGQRLLDDVSPRRHPPRPPPHPPYARWSPTLLASQPSSPPPAMSERWR
ncbi:hypothetical protein O3P69_015328 [Scylla paramamosain]|uniref:Uncharacterized protein n=1 Tax=Scylla paramamosain TaxID=85552 RepID=A0AAW0T3R9_SCYPA